MNPSNTPGRDGNGKGPSYAPWLLIRDQIGDTGFRPLSLGTVFWESPDVWSFGSMGINHPVVGEATQVFAQVSNLGQQDANGVIITYYWANPALAITEASAHQIGVAGVSPAPAITIPSLNTMQFASPTDWTPVLENTGHECLIVQATLPFFDPLTDPLQPRLDRHVGQKNEQLVTLKMGQMLHFQIEAFNFTREARDISVEIVQGVVHQDLAKRFAGRGVPAKFTAAHHHLPAEVRVHDKTVRVVKHSSPAADRLLAPRDHRADHLGKPFASVTHKFGVGEVRHVEVTGKLPDTARPGEVFPLRIFERIGDVVVGGYTLYVTREA